VRAGTEGNERLTAAAAVVLTVLLAAEGVTLLRLNVLLREHMFIGLLLIPPVLLKLASTGYRFARYYANAPRYREKGPPAVALRMLAPLLVATTVVMLATGVALLLIGHRSGLVLELHKVSFIVWSACFGVHFLAHVPRVVRAVADSRGPRGVRVPGAPARGLLVGASITGGVALGVALLALIERWQAGSFG
jgi:hypothetical protein